MKTVLLFLACFVLTLQLSFAREVRTFTNQDGKSIEAEVLDLRDGKIRIMANRKTFEVPVETLSAEDQEWIKEWDAKRLGGTEKKDESAYTELIFADDFDPVRGIHSLAIIDVGSDDHDRIESRSDALELDMCGCLDSGL